MVPVDAKFLLVIVFPKVALIELGPLVNERVGVFKTQVNVLVATEAVSELEATKRME